MLNNDTEDEINKEKVYGIHKSKNMERYKLAARRVSETGCQRAGEDIVSKPMSCGRPKMLAGFETTLS